MKITGIKTSVLTQLPTSCLVELDTDQGLTGICVGPVNAGSQAKTLTRDVLVDEDPRAVSALWQKLLRHSAGSGNGKADYRAIALLDMALWDLKAKSNGEPLWKTLGGARPRANAYVSMGSLSLDDEEIFRRCLTMAERYGFREGKLTLGLEAPSDRRRLGLLREALLQTSAYPVLMIDANRSCSPKQAISGIREIEELFDLTWVETSEQAWGLDGIKEVSDNIFAAVCATTDPHTDGRFFPPFNRHAIDIISLSMETAGITGSLQIADAAYGFELPVTLAASPGNIAAHIAAALPNFMSMEVLYPASSDGILQSDVSIEDGYAVVGDKPGNGLAIARDAPAKEAQ